jgi:hypothetical protein
MVGALAALKAIVESHTPPDSAGTQSLPRWIDIITSEAIKEAAEIIGFTAAIRPVQSSTACKTIVSTPLVPWL